MSESTKVHILLLPRLNSLTREQQALLEDFCAKCNNILSINKSLKFSNFPMFFAKDQIKFLRNHHCEDKRLILFRYKEPRSKKRGHLRLIGGIKYDDSFYVVVLVIADIVERTNRTYKDDYLARVMKDIESFLDSIN